MQCIPSSPVCSLDRIASALESGPTWFDWLTFAVQAVGIVATVFVAVVAIVIANRASKAEAQRAERARRVACAVRLKDWAGTQTLRKTVGSWTIDTMGDDGGTELPSLANAADSPNAQELFAWVFSDIAAADERDATAIKPDVDRLVAWGKEIDAVINAWVENPNADLPPRRGHAVRAEGE